MKRQETFNFINSIPREISKFPVSSAGNGSENTEVTRPIHYLGSKLRIVDLIRDVIDKVEPTGGTVCDLFAGSGTVSLELSKTRNVVAVDIQEYSRVLCSAVLKPALFSEGLIDRHLKAARSSEHAALLSRAIEPLIEYELLCQRGAAAGNLEPLCEILEHGSIVVFQHAPREFRQAELRSAMIEATRRLEKSGMLDVVDSMVTRYFGGIYFSYEQASQIDILLEVAASLNATEKDTFLAAILSTASEIVNTVGKQFAQPIRPRLADGRPKPNLAGRVARDRCIDVWDSFQRWTIRYSALRRPVREHKVLRCDYEDALANLPSSVRVIYADPPYTRDHYSRFYHVLETLCLRDCPPVSTVKVGGNEQLSRGIYRLERYQSPFCIKTKAPAAFSALFSKAHGLNVPLVVSYSHYEKETGARPRLMTIKQITQLAREYFTHVEILPAGRIAHSKLNRSDRNKAISYEAETFLICKP